MLYDENGEVKPRVIMTCVNFHDYLAITLPKNKHHFKEVMIVTSRNDLKTLDIGLYNGCRVYRTDAFYDNGADFNKWKALEEGLDRFGRHGWILLKDPDIIWPNQIPDTKLTKGNLYTPFRRMFENHNLIAAGQIPSESDWKKFPRHRVVSEFSGYSQIFHADDPHIGNPPWHEINWKHAGGADSFFQAKWPVRNKIRPSWEVLHLGQTLQWAGRSSMFLDGTSPENAKGRKLKLQEYLKNRRRTRSYDHEKLK